MKVKNDHRSKFANLRNWKEEAWKNQGFNGIRTRDIRDTGAMLYQLSYEATHWERGQLVEFISSREEWVHHLQPQFIYELFHINFTSFHSSREDVWFHSFFLQRKQNWTVKSINLKENAGEVKSVFVIRAALWAKKLGRCLVNFGDQANKNVPLTKFPLEFSRPTGLDFDV